MISPRHSLIVGIAGGSASGKSTFSQYLVEILQRSHPPVSIRRICTDAYFLPATSIPKYLSPSTGLETPDYNRPDSIDCQKLITDLDDIRSAADHPDILILEGLMVLHIPDVRQRLDLRLFIELEPEARALRRLVRNLGKTYDPIVDNSASAIANYYLESAAVGHRQYIEPSRVYADIILRGDGDFQRTASLVADVIRARLPAGE